MSVQDLDILYLNKFFHAARHTQLEIHDTSGSCHDIAPSFLHLLPMIFEHEAHSTWYFVNECHAKVNS